MEPILAGMGKRCDLGHRGFVKSLGRHLLYPEDWAQRGNVGLGSLAAAARSNRDVRFTPESCRGCRRPARPLRGHKRTHAPQQFAAAIAGTVEFSRMVSVAQKNPRPCGHGRG